MEEEAVGRRKGGDRGRKRKGRWGRGNRRNVGDLNTKRGWEGRRREERIEGRSGSEMG